MAGLDPAISIGSAQPVTSRSPGQARWWQAWCLGPNSPRRSPRSWSGAPARMTAVSDPGVMRSGRPRSVSL